MQAHGARNQSEKFYKLEEKETDLDFGRIE